MKVLVCKILIGNIVFNCVNSVEIESSWELLTDKAVIKLPGNLKLNNNKLSKYIKHGDTVSVKIGYNNHLNTVFTGYITNIKPKVPIEISCEDEMWNLKQDTIVDSGKKMNLEKLVNKHYSDYKVNYYNIELGNYYIDNVSRAKVLEQIKSDFGLYSFFRNDSLVIGKRYDKNTANTLVFKLDSNESNIVTDNLEFKSKDQVRLKIKAISNNADGSKTEIELGSSDGESRTLNFYNLSKSELKEAADREKERLIYDGWRGSFTAFGEPFVKQGDIVKLKLTVESDKEGFYWVDSVKTSFSTGGFRQEIKLGART